MKPGMDLLLAVLRGTPIPASPDWLTALALAQAESVQPWFIHQAQALGIPLPPAFAAARRQAQLDTFLLTSELTSLLKSFASASLPVLLLKGPSLAARVYGSAALRPARDLDLLVRPEHFPPAQTLLASLGFTPNYHPDDYHQSLSRNTTTVELHYNVENPLTFDFNTASSWQSAIPAHFQGQPAHLFAPADELLYLCLHGTRHRFERLSHTLDIALALQHLGPPKPASAQLFSVQELGLLMANKLIPAGRGGATPLHLGKLADRLWQHVLTQPESPADWEALHRFYLELEPTPRARLTRRLRQGRILATRITQPDRDFALRLGFQHPWAAHLLRPIRLLLDRV